jgi:hypothetical protein
MRFSWSTHSSQSTVTEATDQPESNMNKVSSIDESPCTPRLKPVIIRNLTRAGRVRHPGKPANLFAGPNVPGRDREPQNTNLLRKRRKGSKSKSMRPKSKPPNMHIPSYTWAMYVPLIYTRDSNIKLSLHQLESSITQELLNSTFSPCGSISRIQIRCSRGQAVTVGVAVPKDVRTARDRQYATIEFKDAKAARNALRLNGKVLDGCQLVVRTWSL